MSLTIRCRKHPRYAGLNSPKHGWCKGCMRIYRLRLEVSQGTDREILEIKEPSKRVSIQDDHSASEVGI